MGIGNTERGRETDAVTDRAVQGCSLFQGIDQNTVDVLLKCSKRLPVKAGDVLLRKGQIPDKWDGNLPLGKGFLIVSKDGMMVDTDYGGSNLRKGDILGELGFRSPFRGRATSVTAISDGEVVAVPFSIEQLGLSLKDANSVRLALLRESVLPIANEQLAGLRFLTVLQREDQEALTLAEELLGVRGVEVNERRWSLGEQVSPVSGAVLVLTEGSVLVNDLVSGKQLAQVDAPNMIFERVGAGIDVDMTGGSGDGTGVVVKAYGDVEGRYVPLSGARGKVSEVALSAMIGVVERSLGRKLMVIDEKITAIVRRDKENEPIDLLVAVEDFVRNFRAKLARLIMPE